MKENEDLDASEVDSHRSEDSNEVKHWERGELPIILVLKR